MEDTIVLKYTPHPQGSGPEYTKNLLKIYPRLKQTQRLVLVVPHNVESYGIANLLATTSPNVFLFSNSQQSDATDLPKDLVTATCDLLNTHGLLNPFSDGFQLPKFVKLDLEADFGISVERLQQLGEIIRSTDFCAHSYTPDEQLVIIYLLFKQLLTDKRLPLQMVKSDEDLLYFVAVCRLMYKSHLPFHSFWHCTDVTQFTVTLLLNPETPWPDLVAEQRLALSLAALGHDMLHPGVVTPVLAVIDPAFKSTYGSLEIFHSRIFHSVLLQLWPEMIEHWDAVISQGIEATELAKHTQYLDSDNTRGSHEVSFVHALKISDFASCARFSQPEYDITAHLIFDEMVRQRNIADDMQLLSRSSVSAVEQTIESLQVGFLQNLVIPYFEWLAERICWFQQYLDRAHTHLSRYVVSGISVEPCQAH